MSNLCDFTAVSSQQRAAAVLGTGARDSTIMRGSILAALVALASADAPAKSTLLEMVTAINDGSADNNFHAGDFTVSKRESIQVAGCLLDKVVAITVENGIEEFANDLLVDLAACCTRGPDGCVASLAESYLAIGALGKLDGFSSTKRTKPLVVAQLVNHARALSIDAPEELLPSGQKLLARCKGGADECSPEEVAELFKLSIRERDEL